jgi:hypothetical protein
VESVQLLRPHRLLVAWVRDRRLLLSQYQVLGPEFPQVEARQVVRRVLGVRLAIVKVR